MLKARTTCWTDVNLMTEMICGDLENIGIVAEPNMIDWDVHVDCLQTLNFDWIDFTWAAGFPSIGPTYPVSAYKALFTGTPSLASNWCGYEASPNYERVSELIDEMWTVPIGSPESIAAAKKKKANIKIFTINGKSIEDSRAKELNSPHPVCFAIKGRTQRAVPSIAKRGEIKWYLNLYEPRLYCT